MKTEILRLDNVSLQMSGIMQLERFNLQIFSGEIMGCLLYTSQLRAARQAI